MKKNRPIDKLYRPQVTVIIFFLIESVLRLRFEDDAKAQRQGQNTLSRCFRSAPKLTEGVFAWNNLFIIILKTAFAL